MERLAAELKEKEEQEKIKKQRLATRPQPRPQGGWWVHVGGGERVSVVTITLSLLIHLS